MSPSSLDETCVAASLERRKRLHLTASVLALALATLTTPTFAQQTGGNAANGAGGSTSPTNGTATDGDNSGGGGAGVAGGKGGDGNNGAAGGAGGATAGAIGSNGSDDLSASGGGGGGGAHGAVDATFPLAVPVTGGDGGDGGRGSLSGGGGGGGGYGVFITSAGTGGVSSQTITGGNGGNAGSSNNGYDASGGAGGVGVFFAATGASLTNSGAITGGNGGTRTNSGQYGLGGAGVVGAGLTIDNRGGTITGGLSGNGVTRANAITFSGGANTLTLSGTGGLSGNVAVDGAGTLTFNQSTAVTLANVITGTGSIIQNGTGTLALAGANTYSGGTTITSGTLQIGAGGTTGSISGAVINNSMLAFNRSDAMTFGGVMSGSGAVHQNGTGTTTLTGANTYTGTTTISAGALNIQHASALGTTAGGTTVAAGAALQMQGGITVTGEALTLNGTGVANDGALRSISGTNQYLQTITLGSASLITADVTGSFNLRGITGANTDLAFGGAGSVFVNNDITTGTGSLTKDGAGYVILFGNNTYTGVTTINAGQLQVANGHAIADTGVVVVHAAGQFTLGSSETIGSLAGAGDVQIRGYEKLTTGGNNTSTTFSGVISEMSYANAELAKIGTGTFTLTGNSTYTGATTVDGGTLSVNGSIATSSMTTVNTGGTLGGTGFVGNTTINGGTLAPGNSIGTLTVQGNLSFTAASTYLVEVSPNNVDRVNVTGTATLGSATVNASFAAGTYVEKQYTILNAQGGVSGKFSGPVNTNLPSNFKSALSTDANNAYLNLTLDFTPTPNPTPTPDTPSSPNAPTYRSLTGNQGGVARALENFFTRTGGIPLVFGSLDAKGLSQVSGELAPGSQQTSFDVANIFMTQMTDPFAAGRGEAAPGALPYADEAMAYAAPKRAPTDAFASMHRKAQVAAPQERWNVWAAGFGGSQTTHGNATAGTSNSKSSIYGMAVGADYWFSPYTVAGLSMAGGGTNFSVNGGGSGRSDLFQVGGFVRHMMGSVYVSAAAAYGWQDITTDRAVTVAGFDQLRAKFNANSYSGRVEVGNRFATPWIGGLGLTPYGAVQVTAFDLPSYAESVVAGSNTFALAYSGKTITATRTELGLRTDKSFAVNDAILTLRGRAAWAHDFNTDRSAAATFQSLPGASFVVNGAALARNAALTTASAELKWMNGWSVAGTFEGEFSDVTRSYAGKGVVRYAW